MPTVTLIRDVSHLPFAVTFESNLLELEGCAGLLWFWSHLRQLGG